MILYSIIPMETVFENMDQVEKQELKELSYGQAKMLIEQTGPFEGKIVRLISPNPHDYMNPRCAPGQPVHFTPDWLS